MDPRTFKRHQDALRLTPDAVASDVARRLTEAVDSCRALNIDPSTDPAVQLLLDHMGRRSVLIEPQRDGLRAACRRHLWDMARPTIVAALTAVAAPCRERRAAFCRVGRHVLHELAARLGWPRGAYDVRVDPGDRELGAEAVLHGETVYVRIAQKGPKGCEVRFRRCEGRGDFRPKPALFASAAEAGDPVGLARLIETELGLGRIRIMRQAGL